MHVQGRVENSSISYRTKPSINSIPTHNDDNRPVPDVLFRKEKTRKDKKAKEELKY